MDDTLIRNQKYLFQKDFNNPGDCVLTLLQLPHPSVLLGSRFNMIMVLAQNSEVYSVRQLLQPQYDKILEHVMRCEKKADVYKLEMYMNGT